LTEASPQEERHQLATVATATSTGYAVVMIGSLMTGSPNLFVSLFMTVELLSYIPLINMSLTSHQVDLLIGSNQVQRLSNYIPGLDCAPPQNPRQNFDFNCTNFMRIAQKELCILSTLCLVMLVALISACASKGCRSSESLKKVLDVARKLFQMVLLDCLVKATYAAQHTGVDSVEEVCSWILVVLVWLLYLFLGGLGCFAVLSESYPLLKHFLFSNLKSTSSARLHFSLLTLHRISFACFIILLDASKVQLLCLSIITVLVSPRQFSSYLLIVRPFQITKHSILELGSHCVVSAFLCFLTLFEFEVLGDSKDLVSTGFMWCIMSILVLHVLALLAAIASTVKEILQTDSSCIELS
jgi:hypothetical protein